MVTSTEVNLGVTSLFRASQSIAYVLFYYHENVFLSLRIFEKGAQVQGQHLRELLLQEILNEQEVLNTGWSKTGQH